jgi:hypothetical protein
VYEFEMFFYYYKKSNNSVLETIPDCRLPTPDTPEISDLCKRSTV